MIRFLISLAILVWLVLPGWGQTPVCTSATVNPVGIEVAGSNGINGYVGDFGVVVNPKPCRWEAVSTVPWVTLSFGQAGTFDGTIGFRVQNNNSPYERFGQILVAGAVFSIAQAGASCAYTVAPNSITFAGGGSTSTINVSTSCLWGVATSASWITLSPASGGSGNGTFTATAVANPSPTPRSAIITVGIPPSTVTISVTQTEGDCTYAVNPTSLNVQAAASTQQVQVTTTCSWSAQANVPWLTLTPPTNGTGNGTVNFSVASNVNSATSRTGGITIGNATVSVSQAAGSCAFTLTPAQLLDAPASGGTYSIAVATPCSNWTAVSPVSWIQITSGAAGNGNGSITYIVQPNPTTQPRTATLTIGTTTFAIRQVGAACTFSVAPATVNVSAAGGSGQFNITTIAGCSWGVSSSVPWARATVGTTGGTQGTANFTVDANPTVEPRSGTFTIAGQVIPIEQAGQPMTITAAGIVNAASFKGTSIAPGEILSIFGIGIGPANPVSMQLNADRTKVLDQIGETRVLFDGTPSPMVFTSSGQVSCVVPYSMAGKTSVPIEVEYQGRKSNRVTMPVLPTSPGLFTINASGSGQGAFLNQNGSVNGPANPAQRGQVIVLYGTGEGVLRPPLADGAIAPLAEPFPRPVVPVTVRIGNLEAQVTYAGSAPGLVAGAFQINAVIPATAPVGAAVPVQVIIGGVESPIGVTFAVR